jgi:outer membrane protein assembly factor BamB
MQNHISKIVTQKQFFWGLLILMIFPSCINIRHRCNEEIIQHAANSSSKFHERWIINNVFLDYVESNSIPLVATKNYILVYGRNSFCGSNTVTAIDNMNGELIWNDVDSIPFGQQLNHIAGDDSRLYTGYIGSGKTSPNSIIGAGGVATYDIHTGKLQWSRPITGTHKLVFFAVDDSVIGVNGRGLKNHILSGQSGEFLSELEARPEERHITYAFWLEYLFNKDSNNELLYENVKFWTGLIKDVLQPPQLADEIVVARTNSGLENGHVKTFSRSDGNLLWETEGNVVSNVAINEDTAFYITTDLEVKAVDLETGTPKGSITFSPTSGAVGNRAYFIAAYEENVVVYLGDSRQLFSFSYLPEN